MSELVKHTLAGLKDIEQTDTYLQDKYGLSRDKLSGIIKPLANFSHLNLEGVDFSHADLRGANFSGCKLSGVKFDHAKLQGTIFSGAGLGHTTLINAHLSGADFSKASLIQTSFKGANLSSNAYEIDGKTYQKQTTFDLLRSSEVNFQNAKIEGVSFLYAILTGANFQGATFGLIKLRETAQGGLRTYPVDFRWAFMTHAILNGVTCRGIEVVLGQSRLDMAEMRHCNLQGQVFSSEFGSLWQANLTGSNLSNIYCIDGGFNMVGTNLENCNLSGAGLDEIIFSSSSTLFTGAIYDKLTLFPQDFSPKTKGLTLKEVDSK